MNHIVPRSDNPVVKWWYRSTRCYAEAGTGLTALCVVYCYVSNACPWIQRALCVVYCYVSNACPWIQRALVLLGYGCELRCAYLWWLHCKWRKF